MHRMVNVPMPKLRMTQLRVAIAPDDINRYYLASPKELEMPMPAPAYWNGHYPPQTAVDILEC